MIKEVTKEEFSTSFKRFILFLSDKFKHNFEIKNLEEDSVSIESDIFCKKCNNTFWLDLSVNKYYYTLSFENISYIFSQEINANHETLTCDEYIIKSIIE